MIGILRIRAIFY